MLLLGAAGCEKSCDKVKRQLCGAYDRDTCRRLRTWLDTQLEKQTEREAERTCESILDSDELYATWRRSAEKALSLPAYTAPR